MSVEGDHYSLATIAGRLGKSPRWLQSRLIDDGRQPEERQRLQHHHFVGRSKRWSEIEFKALEAAIVAADKEGALRRAGARAALERVLAVPLRPTPSAPPKRSGTRGRSRSATGSSTASSRVFPFP
jgi:hypothetical protein